MAAAAATDPATASSLAPTDDPRETSGLTTRLILAYVKRAGGRPAVDAVLERSGLAGRESELRDENAWFADATRVRLFEAAAAELGDPLVARHIGEAGLDLEVGHALKLALRALGSPRLIYSNIVRANAKFNSVHRMDLLELSGRGARIRNVPLGEAEYHPTDCEYNIGLLSSVPRLFGEPPARVSHPVCIDRGDAECVYEVEWSGGGAVRSALDWTLPGMLGVAGSLLLARRPTTAAAVAASGSAAVGYWRRLSARRRRPRLLEAQASELSEATERLTASLQDLVSGLDLDEVLEKVTRNAQAAVGGTEFVLLVEESGELRCRGSSALPAGSVAALERWAQSLPGLLEGPVLIDDLDTVPELEPLSGDSHPRLCSACAAPLVYGERPLGVLVALAPGADGFLPHDVELLSSYAAQAAIALTNARLYRAQQHLATQDPLTGLLNHREFHDTVARELERCRRYGGELSIVMLDLDNFKLVNDAGGHAAGDRVLRRVADALAGTCRGSDLAFRVGGDEFALVLPSTGGADAESAAARARAAVNAVDRRTSASTGIASWPTVGSSKDALLEHADASLYEAKRGGGVPPQPTSPADPPASDAIDAARRRERLASASRLAAKLAPLLDPVEIARMAVDELQGSFDYLVAAVHRVDDDGNLRPVAGAGPLMVQAPGFQSWAQSLDEGIVGRAARTGEPALVRDTRRDPDYLAGEAPIDVGSELDTPIRVAGDVWGVLNLEQAEIDGFDTDDVLFADTVAAAVGAAIHRSQLFAELEGTFLRTVAVLSDALEAKDAYTASHAREVAELSERVGARLGMPAGERRTLTFAALLHDIGKIGIRSELLARPGSLSAGEFDEVKQHAAIGAEMLEPIPHFSDVHRLVRWTHERWDSHGYPDGLAGEEIPLGSRIIAACDALHAMISDRPYRRAVPIDVALAELRAHAGTQFDPAVIDVLVDLMGGDAGEASDNGNGALRAAS